MQHFRKALLLVVVVSISAYSRISFGTITETTGAVQSSHKKSEPETPFWRHERIDDSKNAGKANGSYTRFQVHSSNIDSIRIVGERHSGTTFLTRYLKACFPTRTVSDVLINGKHWFQPNPQYVEAVARKYGKAGLAPTLVDDLDSVTWWQIAESEDPKSKFNNTLVIALFRNPYQWVEAMRRWPHHWPNHANLLPKTEPTLAEINYTRQKEIGKFRRLERKAYSGRSEAMDRKSSSRPRRLDGEIIQKSFVTSTMLDWQDFVERPLYLADYNESDAGILCQKGFTFGTVSPCDTDHSYVPEKIRHIPRSFLRNLPFEADEAMYELDIDGRPFQNIMQLRAAKISNFLNLVHKWNFGGFAGIRYEDIIGDRIAALVQNVESAIQVDNNCPKLKSFYRESYNISNEFQAWVAEKSDWRVEALVGYFPGSFE